MHRIARLFTIFTLVAFAASAHRSGEFQWPDSSRWWRVLVNVNQYIKTYLKAHPQWFSQDKLVTDFAVQDIPDKDAAAKEYKSVRKLLESHGMYVGTYTSGTTLLPEDEQTHYPPATVSLEQMPATARYVGSWPGHPTRKIVDLSDPNTRHAFQANIRRMWETWPAQVRFLDNAAIHRSAGGGQRWEDYCKNFEEIRQIGESVGSRVIFNISVHVGLMSDKETQQLIRAVGDNGISLEMPWHSKIRADPEATRRAQMRYRQLLDTGMAIIMIPILRDTPEDVLAAWVRTWRKPTDHLYMAGIFWKPPNLIADEM